MHEAHQVAWCNVGRRTPAVRKMSVDVWAHELRTRECMFELLLKIQKAWQWLMRGSLSHTRFQQKFHCG